MPSSLLLTSKTTRKPPRERLISNDKMDTFRERDITLSGKKTGEKWLILDVSD